MTKIGIIGNCQALAAGDAMRLMSPNLEIVAFPVYGLSTADDRAKLVEQLSAMDIVLVTKLDGRFGQFATDRVKDLFKRVALMPSVFFTGFHPDQVYLPAAYRDVLSPTVHLHSRIVLAARLSGRSVEEAVGLFNALVYSRLGYFDAYDAQFDLLVRESQSFGSDLTREIDKWRNSGCFMYSINHPKAHVIVDLAEHMLHRLDLEVIDRRQAEGLADDLAGSIRFPVYPEIAERRGVEGSLSFQTTHGEMSLDQYVRASYAAYARVPREALRAPGVDAALNVLSS